MTLPLFHLVPPFSSPRLAGNPAFLPRVFSLPVSPTYPSFVDISRLAFYCTNYSNTSSHCVQSATTYKSNEYTYMHIFTVKGVHATEQVETHADKGIFFKR